MTTYLSPCFYVMPVSVCRRWCECACDRDTTTTTAVPCASPSFIGRGLGGGNVPPLPSPIPLSHFVPLSLLTTWSSPRFSFSCVYVCVCSCDYDGGVWGGRSPPQLFHRWTQSRRDPAFIEQQPPFSAGASRTLSTSRHTTDHRQIRAFEEFQLPVVQFHSHLIPLGYFVVFGVSVDPCCPVQRRPACDGCVTTVRYRCPLTRMTCVCRVCCPCPRTGGGVRVRVTDRTTTTPVPGAL